ncbi:MAG: NAD(P)H-hydrate epimerase, partial [Myxococcota bacterium]|nr:NAD(P)H-hydrate epimerase [Myxococcota bacterium]
MDLDIIHKLGMPAHTLMEIAGKGAADLIHHLHPHEAVHIFCGAGNNGGDGYVIARWLALWGHIVHVSVISPPKTESCTTNHSLCK